MKRLIALTLVFLFLFAPFAFLSSPTPAAAAAPCPNSAATLIRVGWFWQDYRLGFYQPGVSKEFPALVDLQSQFTGEMHVIYIYDPITQERIGGYWHLDDGRDYYATEQAYPYILEYYEGKYDGQSECQLLIGVSPEYPDLAFVYIDNDYWQDLNDGDTEVHPAYHAWYMPKSALIALLGEPTVTPTPAPARKTD